MPPPESATPGRSRILRQLSTVAILLSVVGPGRAAESPDGITRQLPSGYDVLSTASVTFDRASRAYTIVALGRPGETAGGFGSSPASVRPLLLFKRKPDGSFRLAGRNDAVILRADEGGQCDPFLDGGGVIGVQGRSFTVHNGVACGQHWTDDVTFRFERALGRFVFDHERFESWSFNRSDDPGAEALVPDGPPRIRRGDPAKPITFDAFRRSP